MPTPVALPDSSAATSTPATRAAGFAGLLTAEVIFGGALFVLAFGVFFYLTRVVFQEHSQTFDDWGFAQMDRLNAAVPGLEWWVENVITRFGSVWFFVPVSVLTPWLLHRAGYTRYAIELLLSMAGGVILNQLLKLWFQRPRPTTALIHQYGLSFPSGHSMMSMAFYGCLAWLAVQHGRRWGMAVGLVVFALLIGLTRIFLHVHFATDVVAGFAAGAMWLVMLRTGLRVFWKEKKIPGEAASVSE
jgi:membrane-associated phospholipid phosphatase